MYSTIPLYGIWNYDYIQQKALQQYHQSQEQQVIDAAHKLQDFLDSADRVDPAYQGSLSFACCAVLDGYARKHRII